MRVGTQYYKLLNFTIMKQSTKYFLTAVICLIVAICLISKNNLFCASVFAFISFVGIIAYNKEESVKESK